MITILDFVRSVDEVQGAVWQPEVREQMLYPVGRLEIVVEDKLTERVLHVDECYVMAGQNQLRLVINTAAARAILEREQLTDRAVEEATEIFAAAEAVPFTAYIENNETGEITDRESGTFGLPEDTTGNGGARAAEVDA